MKNGPTLGKGLAALLGDDLIDNQSVHSLPIHQLFPNPKQPRQHFDSESLKELVSSIREKGVLQPLLVRLIKPDQYEIIAGERRFRASKEVGLSSVPVVILTCGEDEALEIGLIENLQRDDLNPLEEAICLDRLIQTHHRTQEQVAQAIGKSRSYVANILRLNHLHDEIKEFLRTKKISAGHARALLNTSHALEIARVVIEKNLSVRETEDLVRKFKVPLEKPSLLVQEEEAFSEIQRDMDILAKKIGDFLKVPVHLSMKKQKAILTLEFHHWDQLDDLCQILHQSHHSSTGQD